MIVEAGAPTSTVKHGTRWQPLREAAAEVPWRRVAIGYALAMLTGVLLGVIMQRAGNWSSGYGWERTFMFGLHQHVVLPTVLDAIVLVIPWIGTNITLFPLDVILAIWLYRKQRADLALTIMVAQLGNTVLNAALKHVGHRDRPDLWPRRGQYDWQSFPSGHMVASISVLFLLAWLYWRERGSRWPFIVVGTIFVISLFSRVYLGVHWPTDVLAGIVIGLIWLVTVLTSFPAARGRPTGAATRAAS